MSTEDVLYDTTEIVRHNVKAGRIVALISLDIEGAFDHAWWPSIRKGLKEYDCEPLIWLLIDDYLKERRVTLQYAACKLSPKPPTRALYRG